MFETILLLPLCGALIAGLFGCLLRALGGPNNPSNISNPSSLDSSSSNGSGSSTSPSSPSNLGIWDGWGDLGSYIATRLTCILMLVGAILSIIAFFNLLYGGASYAQDIILFDWISIGSFNASWGLKIDALTIIMLLVVNLVSCLVHIYSLGYMGNDQHQARFFSYLSFFTFAMLALVTADNFLQLFFGWEAVGLASYLLIGFWYEKDSACAASLKAFIVNRVGDFGLILGIAAIYLMVGSVEYDVVFAAAPYLASTSISFFGAELPALTTICLLLFLGACGKSAQLFLHTWLPDAMEGPTPVSALIHAATMVTAGIFLLARCSPLFDLSPDALYVVVAIGALTALFAATIGLVQNDIKRVIAYSTCSQLGYMFVALGLGAYQIAIFHLFTHAFFKALLFLSAGSIIHGVGGEQDIRKMGGLCKMMPYSWFFMLIGTLALTGFPFTAGYYSKDGIIEAAFVAEQSSAHIFAFVVLLLAAICTSFYSWRLFFVIFYGKVKLSSDQYGRIHEAPLAMALPLLVLACGALGVGILFHNDFLSAGAGDFWQGAIVAQYDVNLLEGLHRVPFWVKFAPFVMMLMGFGLAFWFYMLAPAISYNLSKTHHLLYKLLLNKYYFDELYHFVLVRPFRKLAGILWRVGDEKIIDGIGPDGVAKKVLQITRRVVRLQTGLLYHYAFVMLLGIAGFVSWFMLMGGVQ